MGRRWDSGLFKRFQPHLAALAGVALFAVAPGCFRSDMIWMDEATHKIEVTEPIWFTAQTKTAGQCLYDFGARFVKLADGEVDASLENVPVDLVLYSDSGCTSTLPVYDYQTGGYRSDGVIQHTQSGVSGLIPFFPNTPLVSVTCNSNTPGQVTRAGSATYLKIRSMGFGSSACMGPLTILPAPADRVRGVGMNSFPVGTASPTVASVNVQLQDAYGNWVPLPAGASVTVNPNPTPLPTSAAYPGSHGLMAGSVALAADGSGQLAFDPVYGTGKIKGLFTISGTVSTTGLTLSDNTFSANYTLTGHLGASSFQVKDLPQMQLFTDHRYTVRVSVIDSYGNAVNDYTGTVNTSIYGYPAGSATFYAWDGGEKVVDLVAPNTALSSVYVDVTDGTISGTANPATVTVVSAPAPTATPSSPPVASLSSNQIAWSGVTISGDLNLNGGTHVIDGPGQLVINGNLNCIPGSGLACRLWINGDVRVKGNVNIHSAGIGSPSLVYLAPGGRMEVDGNVNLGTSGSYYGTGIIVDSGATLAIDDGYTISLQYGGQFISRGSPGRRAEIVSTDLGSKYFSVNSAPNNYGFSAYHTNFRGLSKSSGLGLNNVSQPLLAGVAFTDYQYDASVTGGTLITLGSGLAQNSLFDLRFEHAPIQGTTTGMALINPCGLSTLGGPYNFALILGHGFNPMQYSVTNCSPSPTPNINWSFTGAY
ncbi:MAG: hypothetical protein JNL01_05695 [Bdellovibrionales bacterium]|nr:hypothetical protein [Bdellovibrionales bacterium]